MPLNLFYITNRPAVALLAERYGVNRIWIDLETIGKEERQPGNTVKSHHSISDIALIKPLLSHSQMLVRVNPWNENSVSEINAVIDAGADIIMLPFWKTLDEVKSFLSTVNGRVKTTLLLETKEAVEIVDDVLELEFDEIHIGLNDLHLSYGMTFMFELLSDGTVEMLCKKFKAKGIPYGFGGVARLGKGMLPAEKVIMEHYRLGSTRAILSRAFCDINKCENIAEVERLFSENMVTLREYEKFCENADEETLLENKREVEAAVRNIVEGIRERERVGV